MRSSVTTGDTLGVFFEGEERKGVSAYGLWVPSASRVSPVLADWPSPAVMHEQSLQPVDGPAWEVVIRDIAVEVWPPLHRWRETIANTLRLFCDAGAIVSWCAVEGYFSEPPHLFDDRMAEGVWAVFSPTLGLRLKSELNSPLQAIDEQTRIEVRNLLPPQLK